MRELASSALINKVANLYLSSKWDQGTSAIKALATNGRLRATGFYVGSAEEPMQQAAAQCMSLNDWFDVSLSNPKMVSDYIKAATVLGTALHSSDFKDGMVLKTMHPAVNLTLAKKLM